MSAKGEQLPVPGRSSAWLLSVGFWLTLLAAAALYALSALSPKLQCHFQEKSRWWANQNHLVRLERRVDYLQRVAQALEADPDFSAELARRELDASRPGEERIPVPPELTLDAVNLVGDHAAGPPPQLWYEPLITLFAQNDLARRGALFAAAGLLLFAFVFLHESQIGRLRPAARIIRTTTVGIVRGCRWLGRRYRRVDEDGPWGIA